MGAAASRFPQTTVDVGEKRRRAFTIRCSRCGETATVTHARLHAGFGDEDHEKTLRQVSAKFERIGWKIGKDRGRDLCVGCQVKITQAEQAKMQNKAALKNMENRDVKSQTVIAPVAGKPQTAAPPPREMSWKDSALIAQKLGEVYIDKDKGYGDGWTDAKLAADLGVPRDWVKRVRVEMYGEGVAGNDDIEEAIKGARTWLEDCRTACKANEASVAQVMQTIAGLRDRADRIERTLSGIEASLR